jgi:hypothetical protein
LNEEQRRFEENTWITGTAALAVLNLALDGRDLATDCRLI